MKKIKILSMPEYKSLVKKRGERAIFYDVEFKKNHLYRCVLNASETKIYLPIIFAEKILNENI